MATATTLAPAATQPDIQYQPDYQKYQARAAQRVEEDDLPKTLPAGFPAQLHSDLVWDGATLAESYDWTYVLQPDHLAELDAALAHFKSLNLPLGHIGPDTFPLPRLRPELRRLSGELHRGRGFFVLRGLPVEGRARSDAAALYAGVSAHVAARRGRQDGRFGGRPADVVLTHVRDLGGDAEAAALVGSPAYTREPQVFHTDAGDVVALLALGTAAAGGASKLASIGRVYNELAAARPDLVHTLVQEWPFEVFGKPEKTYASRPLLYYQPATGSAPERLALQYARRYFVGYGALPRSAEIPPITEAQAEALDALHFLGEKLSVSLDFRKGDVQYVNNLALFHARDGYTDSEEKHRHLLRLWLRDPENAWETPEPLKDRWAQLYDGVTPESQVFPLEPYIRSESSKNR